MKAVVLEGFPGNRAPAAENLLANDGGIAADLPLGVGIHSQGQEMQQIVEVDLPVGLGIG